MTERLFLVDNNALSKLTATQRTSEYFANHCHVTSDVLHEAEGYVEGAVAQTELPTTPAALRRLIEIMATLEPGDTSLVDLYANKGAADPVIIAIALEAQACENDTLLPKTWVIVTDDKAVTAIGGAMGVEVLPSSELRAQLPS